VLLGDVEIIGEDLRLRRGGLLGCAGAAGDGEHMQIPVEAQPLERGAAEDLPQQPVLIGRDDVGGHALAGSDRGMGHQLHAPRRARGQQSARLGSDVDDRLRPGGGRVLFEIRMLEVVDGSDAQPPELCDGVIAECPDHHRLDAGGLARGGRSGIGQDGAGEGDGLGRGERHLTAGIGFDEYVCHGRITPISSRTSTRAGAASGPSPSLTSMTVGRSREKTSVPAGPISRASRLSAAGVNDWMFVSTVYPRSEVSRMPTWKSPVSAASLPSSTRSKVCPASARSRTTSPMTWAMSSGAKASASAVSMRMPSFAPTATAARSCSTASAGPTVSTVTVPPVAEAVPIASSTAHSSCEDMV